MSNFDHTALLLIGHGTDDPAGLAEYRQMATLVGERLNTVVQPCFLELADPPIAHAIDDCVRAGFRRIVALPLLLGAAGHQKNDIPVALNQARARYPDLDIRYGAPLGVQYTMLQAVADRTEAAYASVAATIPREKTALALIGRGSSDPDSNADVARMARLLWEGRGFGWVEYGFYSVTRPDVATTIRHCVALGADQIIVIPCSSPGAFINASRSRLTRRGNSIQRHASCWRTIWGCTMVLCAPSRSVTKKRSMAGRRSTATCASIVG
jgi:sirohydrochlorin cobaltochelatase